MTLQSTKHLIFDNDGVNIDSEHVAMQVMDDFGYAMVKRYKPDAALEQGDIYEEYPGTSTDVIVAKLIEKHDLPEDRIRDDYDVQAEVSIPEALADRITIETNERFMTDLQAIKGITKSIEKLRDTYGAENIALCTTSREDRMDVSLECATQPDTGINAGLSELFPKGERRVSGYGYSNKYELYLGQSGWDPAQSIVIEDSLSGVTKAKAASEDIRVVGTAAAGFYKDKNAQATALLDAGASIVITDGADLAKAIIWLDAGLDPEQKPDFKSRVFTPDEDSPSQTSDFGANPSLKHG